MTAVRQEGMIVQPGSEKRLTKGNCRCRIRVFETGTLPRLLAGFHDESGSCIVEAIRVRLEPAEGSLDKNKSESLKELMRSQPDKLIFSGLNCGLEVIGIEGADSAVYAIGGNDQIGFPDLLRVGNLGVEYEPHSEGFRPLLEDIQKMFSLDSAKTMAARSDYFSFEVDVYVVPAREAIHNAPLRRPVAALQVFKSLVGKNNAPAECVIREIALVHRNLMRWVRLLHQDGEVKPRRPPSD